MTFSPRGGILITVNERELNKMKSCYVDYTQESVSCIGEPKLRSGREQFRDEEEAKSWIKYIQDCGIWKFTYAAVTTSEIIIG